MSQGVFSQEEITEMQEVAIEKVGRAVEWEQTCPYPDPEDCLKGVYYEG